MASGLVTGPFPQSVARLDVWLADLRALQTPLADLDARDPLLAPDERAPASASAPVPISASLDRLTARRALRLLIERTFGPQYREIPLVRGPRGKPRLEGLPGDFSVSHANGFALIGLGPVARLGLDLEFTRVVHLSDPRRAAIEAAAHTLAPGVVLPDDPERRFLQAWTRLEAVAKATGFGIGRTLSALGVWGGEPPSTPGHPLGERPELDGLTTVDLQPGHGGIAALAVSLEGGPAPSIHRLPADLAALAALRAGAAIAGNSGVDLSPAPPHKGPVRSVAQPG